MRLLAFKLINLASFMYLLTASFFLSQNFMQPSTDNVYVMPAPFAFSIWFVIYLLLFIFLMKSFFANEELNRVIGHIGLWFPLSMFLSGTTVMVGTTPSLLFITLSLLTLCVVYTIIQRLNLSTQKYRTPFSIYLAWTSIATIVDTFVVLKANEVQELFAIGELGWSAFILVVGGLIALAFYFIQKDTWFPLVFIWGYGAIFAYQENTLIKFITGAFVVILLFIIFFSWFQKNRVS
ncbi:TspO/MBR family protein [Halobacillus sp. B29]|uniref:TspO/MBR family protein n=1 Tax=Halobacillus sp. B29 TaxID=3457432 RepID=UPI003FCEB0EB